MSRSIFDPLVPAGAYDAFYADGAARSADQPRWQPSDGALPALYIGHGAPPLLDDAEWMAQLAAWALSMPKPRAVLIVSAHWEAAPLMLSAAGFGTPLVYDFGGFAARYYTLTYPTPDATAFGNRDANFAVVAFGIDRARLDEAWEDLYPHFHGLYLSFETDTRVGRLDDAFPAPTLERLRGLKRRYDPDNAFRDNFNIAPSP